MNTMLDKAKKDDGVLLGVPRAYKVDNRRRKAF